MSYQTKFFKFNSSSISGLIIGALALVLLFVVANGIYRILSFLSPFLLIAAIILNYKIVLDFGKSVLGLLKRDTLMGIGAIVGIVLFFPVISAFLFGKVLLYRKLDSLTNESMKEFPMQRNEKEFVDFEEIESNTSPSSEAEKPKIELILPPRKEKSQPKRNEYDQFFE